MNEDTKLILKKYSKDLYKIINEFSIIDTQINDYVEDISYYTISENDEELNDGYVIGDILFCSLFSDFALFLKNYINKNNVQDKILIQAMNFITDMFNLNNEKIQNIIETCVLEILSDTEKCKTTLRRVLCNSILKRYEEILEQLY